MMDGTLSTVGSEEKEDLKLSCRYMGEHMAFFPPRDHQGSPWLIERDHESSRYLDGHSDEPPMTKHCIPEIVMIWGPIYSSQENQKCVWLSPTLGRGLFVLLSTSGSVDAFGE